LRIKQLIAIAAAALLLDQAIAAESWEPCVTVASLAGEPRKELTIDQDGHLLKLAQ